MRRSLTRAIELVVRVQIMGGEVHLLQCDLDGNGVAAVVFGEMARVSRVFVADGRNSVSQAHGRLQWDPADGSAEESWSGRALIFSPIENHFFQKKMIFGVISARTQNGTGLWRAKWSRGTPELCA